MDLPCSFTQYFVNKQNIRSFSNVINQTYFKCEYETFYKQLLPGEMASELTLELKVILNEVRDNIKDFIRSDFRNHFSITNSNQILSAVDKNYVFVNCSSLLSAIIPKSFFGCNHNRKIFRKITKIIIYSMKRQFFHFSELLKHWDFSKLPWSNLSCSVSFGILHFVLFWIYKYLLCSMISLNFYVTSCKLDTNENKLFYFWKPAWHSFYDKKVSDMLFIKKINKFSNQNPKQRLKRQHNHETTNLKLLKKNIPKLQLILKKNNEYRPIVNYKKDNKALEKYKIKERLNFLKALAGTPNKRIEKQFSTLHSNWLKQNKPRLFFIKTDLSNAFGSINIKKLIRILSERYQKFQIEQNSLSIKKKFALLYKEFVSELQKPLLIRTGSTIYEWKEGLVQGYKYSPALSELYYSYLDELYFCEQLKPTENRLKLFIRVVDDYLYITDCIDDANAFLKALTHYSNVNYSKTVVNFLYPGIEQSSEITFLGHTYDTVTLNTSKARNIFIGQMCYKIAFTSAIGDIEKFLDNRIGQSGIHISSHIFNFNYNKEEIVWKHIFILLCLAANKFCTILAILCNEDMEKHLSVYKKRVTVNICNSIIDTLLRNKPKDFNFIFCINHFRYLSFIALLLCAKNTPKCNGLVPYIYDHVAKSNCIFGKWRDHASRINTDGTTQRRAIKVVCRREDLKQIMKEFNKLPEGFECYNSRKFYGDK